MDREFRSRLRIWTPDPGWIHLDGGLRSVITKAVMCNSESVNQAVDTVMCVSANQVTVESCCCVRQPISLWYSDVCFSQSGDGRVMLLCATANQLMVQ